MAIDTTALGVCSTSCPWPGGPQPQRCGMRNCCNERCLGCQRGYPYDVDLRHIGPIKSPHSNRLDCQRVKWLGRRGALPCEPGVVPQGIQWMNASQAVVEWENNAGVVVPWVMGQPAVPVGLPLAA